MHEKKTASTEFPVFMMFLQSNRIATLETFQSEGEIFHLLSIFLLKYFKLHKGEGEGETITELFIQHTCDLNLTTHWIT